MAFQITQIGDGCQITDNISTTVNGLVVQPAVGSIAVKDICLGPIHHTILTLDNVGQSVVNGTEYQSTEIFDFPAGRILVLGVTASLAQKTTSTITSTINAGVTMALGLGTAAASNVSLTSTMVDLLPSTNLTTSTTINVAGSAVGAALAASAHFDGTSTAKKMYLNTGFATTTDIDGNGTQTILGTIAITWINLGDY